MFCVSQIPWYWRHARRLAADRHDDPTETDIARVLDDLLTRAEHGPDDRVTARVVARTKVGSATHRPLALEQRPDTPPDPGDAQPVAAQIVPFGIFDADAEAERWM